MVQAGENVFILTNESVVASLKIISDTTQFHIEQETAVAIGKFDGVHLGHKRLLQEILEQKKNGLAACVFTFDPPPGVLFGGGDLLEITTKEEKRVLFERMGVDYLIEFPMTYETAAIKPEKFAEDILSKQLQARFIAAGTDLSFGDKGAGDAKLLRKLAPELHFELKTIEKVCIEGVEVNSTYIRELLKQGEMEQVEEFLGFPYTIMGKVVHGNKIGRTIGFPTVNVLPEKNKLLPPNGVYYSRVAYKGNIYEAISNVGYKPTVSSEKVMGVESYLYDFDEEIYEEEVEIYLRAFKRGEQQFASVEELRVQLAEDIRDGALRNDACR